MTIRIDQRFGEVPRNDEEAYKPFFSIRDELEGLIENNEVPLNSVQTVVQSLRSGRMPEKGALIDLGHGVFGAIDLVTIERVSPREAVISPAPKDAVDDDTDEMKMIGGLALTDDLGRLKVTGVVERFNGFNNHGTYTMLGDTALGDRMLLREFGLDAPFYSIVEEDSGILVGRAAVSPTRVFYL